ncbi:MAG TPA: mandelate racemase/muconate lactonizing enzyme family protein [Pyrinomonadaceae bacterium]|nr:mandelate racemase/muconate lactonizing enzyme family protein [Pyrinomonadaceae bacterium]
MKITNVEATWLRYQIPEAGQHTSDFGKLTTFDMTLVRVETDSGLTGYGEAKAAVGSAGVNAPVVSVVNEELRPLLVGQDPRDISGLWERMYNGVRAHYALSYGRAFPELGRRGLRISAISGVDIALWDILGKSLNVPIYQLLGGRCRAGVPGYASGGWASAELIGKQLLETITPSGFAAVKMRVGAMDGDVETSVARVRAAREVLGPGVRLMVDAHGTFDSRAARRFARGVEDCHLSWFEEPVNADDVRGMAEVRASTDIPIAAGESLFTRFDFRDLIDARAVDILQPDPAIAGGITEVVRISALASAHQLTLAPHLWGSALLFAAGLHVAAAVPNCVTLEYSMGFNPMLRELAEEKFTIRDGQVEIPDRPGLGITVDESFVEQYTVRSGRT